MARRNSQIFTTSLSKWRSGPKTWGDRGTAGRTNGLTKQLKTTHSYWPCPILVRMSLSKEEKPPISRDQIDILDFPTSFGELSPIEGFTGPKTPSRRQVLRFFCILWLMTTHWKMLVTKWSLVFWKSIPPQPRQYQLGDCQRMLFPSTRKQGLKSPGF